ncbi:MAG: hypothetical protein HRU16_08935 [Planctomycetes bacterium]|nr:hypothetical protein [Planctomycetota bacterium]
MVDLVTGSPLNMQVLYEGFGLSKTSAGGVGDSIGIVADPALLRDPQSVALRFFLFQDLLNPGFTPVVEGVSVSFDVLPPPPPPDP